MGYIVDGRYITTSSMETRIEKEIMEEIRLVFQKRKGWRFTEYRFNQLSSQEQNDIIHQAGLGVQARRKSR